MTVVLRGSYPFLGFTCAHRVTKGHVVLDDHAWQEVAEVLDERLHAGAPILTFALGGTFLHLRPSARVLVAAKTAPKSCGKHRTPQPLPRLDNEASPPEPDVGGAR